MSARGAPAPAFAVAAGGLERRNVLFSPVERVHGAGTLCEHVHVRSSSPSTHCSPAANHERRRRRLFVCAGPQEPLPAVHFEAPPSASLAPSTSAPSAQAPVPWPAAEPSETLTSEGSGPGDGHGGGSGRGRGGGGGGGGGAGGSGGEGDGEEAAVELPEDLRRALEEGLIDADVVERLEALRRGPVMRQLMRSRAFRDRALADPDMVRKAWVEQGISTVLVLASELKKRGDGFLRELDYVIANFIVGRVTNFLLFAIMAPTLELSGAGKGPLRRYLAALPPYALARSPAGAAPYTAAQRAAAVVYKGLLLGSVGFTAGIVGTGITAALLELNRRRRLRAGEAVPAPPRPRYLFTGLAWFAFMSTASNLRLQAVNGVEGEVYRRAAGTALPFATTVALRLVNTYLGVSQWIDFVRAIGLQPKPKPAAS